MPQSPFTIVCIIQVNVHGKYGVCRYVTFHIFYKRFVFMSHTSGDLWSAAHKTVNKHYYDAVGDHSHVMPLHTYTNTE